MIDSTQPAGQWKMNFTRPCTCWKRSEIFMADNPVETNGRVLPNINDLITDDITGARALVVSVNYEQGTFKERLVIEECPPIVDGAFPEIVSTKPDAGVAAVIRLRARRAAVKTGRVIKVLLLLAILLLCLVAGLVVWYGHHTMVEDHAMDERSCSVKLNDGSVLAGMRTYAYKYREILGQRIIDTKSVDERTTLYVNGETMSIVGQLDVDRADMLASLGNEPAVNGELKLTASKPAAKSQNIHWAISVPPGEKGIQILKAADTYTFVVDGKVAVVDYKSFCK